MRCLKDKGYEYVVIDDCWSLKQRDENGRLVPDPEKFPHGMKAVADYFCREDCVFCGDSWRKLWENYDS